MALVESIGDPTLTVGLSFLAISPRLEAGEMADALRWSQTVIDLADGDPTKGNFLVGRRWRWRWCLAASGRSWLASRMARRPRPRRGHGPRVDPVTYAVVVVFGTTVQG